MSGRDAWPASEDAQREIAQSHGGQHTDAAVSAERFDAAVLVERFDAGGPPGFGCSRELESRGVFELDVQGRSAPIELTFAEPIERVAIAIEPEGVGSPEACYGIEQVRVGETSWVGEGGSDSEDTCVACSQPVRLHPHMGWFVLPSAQASAAFTTLTFRIAMRECQSLLRPSLTFPLAQPRRVRVRTLGRRQVPAEQPLRLAVGTVIAAPALLAQPSADQRAFLAAMRDTVERAFSLAKIEIVWTPEAMVASPPVVRWKPEQSAELEQLASAARTALGDSARGALPLILGPCLERDSLTGLSRPMGTTPHLPGDCSVPTAAVYLAVERCLGEGLAFPNGAALGAIAAHELGHHLGLFHVDEEVSFPSDRARGDENLMVGKPSSSLTLTPAQIEVLRRHFDLGPRE